MIFKLDTGTADPTDMITMVVDGIYLTIHLHPDRRLAFVQTFDEDRGVTIDQTTVPQCAAIVELLTHTVFPAIVSLQDQLRAILSQSDAALPARTSVPRLVGQPRRRPDRGMVSDHSPSSKSDPNRAATKHDIMPLVRTTHNP